MSEDLEIVYRDPAELVPYGKNSRTHSPEQVRQIRRSIDEFSFTNPILLRDDDKSIGAGHGRQLASLLKPALKRVPTVTIRGLSDAQWRALIVADNKLALNAGWDEDILRTELADLQGFGFDLSLTGFTSLELGNIFSTVEGATDPEETPEPPKVPVSQPGDLWLFEGGHRVICGDCTDKGVVGRLLDGRSPVLCSTDSPYGVIYDPAWRSRDVPQVGKFKAPNRAHGAVKNDDRADWREAWSLYPGDVIYVWHDGSNPASTQLALEACGFEIRSQIIWRKTSMVVGRGHFHWAHETCFYAVRKGGSGHWTGGRKQTTVWDIDAPKRSETGHGTQKPVECMARPITSNSAVGDLVYDPFLGSGSTLLGAHMNKRVLVGCEIDPAYVDVIVQRFSAFTGTEPTLAETGETFEAVKARRLAVI